MRHYSAQRIAQRTVHAVLQHMPVVVCTFANDEATQITTVAQERYALLQCGRSADIMRQ